jgi:hypothetical protein
MTATQTEKINMYLGLNPFLDSTEIKWQTLGIFPSIVSKFKLKLLSLQSDETLQAELTTGYAKNKLKKRSDMAEAADRIKSSLQIFAEINENVIIYNKVDFSKTALMEGSAIRSKSRCQLIHDQAALVIEELGPFGVVASDLVELQEKIAAFNAIISDPKSIKGQRKVVNARIRQGIKDIDKILNRQMDKGAAVLSNTASEWVEDYFSVRKIYKHKTQFTEIIATFKNKETGLAVEGVTLKGTGNNGGEFLALSSSNGTADKKQISPEIYNLTWEMPGYESGEMKQVKVSAGGVDQ